MNRLSPPASGRKRTLKFAVLLTAVTSVGFAAHPAHALTYTYAGSWQVGDPGAPSWPDNYPFGPIAYTGQEVAALLFGGAPSEYSISTVSNDPGDINHSAWYSVWGGPGTIFAEDYSNKYLGQYYGPPSGGDGTASAYVADWCGPAFPGNCGINYAFRAPAQQPVPGPLPIMGVGAAFGISRQLRRRINTVSQA